MKLESKIMSIAPLIESLDAGMLHHAVLPVSLQ